MQETVMSRREKKVGPLKLHEMTNSSCRPPVFVNGSAATLLVNHPSGSISACTKMKGKCSCSAGFYKQLAGAYIIAEKQNTLSHLIIGSCHSDFFLRFNLVWGAGATVTISTTKSVLLCLCFPFPITLYPHLTLVTILKHKYHPVWDIEAKLGLISSFGLLMKC